jgi:serine/threonine protein kinase
MNNIKVIGKGQYGKVVMVRKVSNGRVYAMKIIHKKYSSEAERKILEEAKHPFISQLKYAFQSETKVYYVMDYLRGGELFQLLRKYGCFQEEHVRFYAAEIVSALKHLHRLKVAYRDLKPENILLCDEGHLCIVDFGLSKMGVGLHDGASSFVGRYYIYAYMYLYVFKVILN